MMFAVESKDGLYVNKCLNVPFYAQIVQIKYRPI